MNEWCCMKDCRKVAQENQLFLFATIILKEWTTQTYCVYFLPSQ